MADHGFVYAMGNQSMPGVYKIGMTTRSPLKRCEELSSSTSCPTPFDVLCYFETEDASYYEKEIHQELAKYRTNPDREFFECDLLSIVTAFWARACYGYYLSRLVRKKYGINDEFRDPQKWAEVQRRNLFGEACAVGGSNES